jgi:predicted RNase H-like HicB family nuclease
MTHLTSKFTGGIHVKTYVFRIEIEHEEDGRWSAVVPGLPGCTTWGYTKEDAVKSIQEAAQAYVETLSRKAGRSRRKRVLRSSRPRRWPLRYDGCWQAGTSPPEYTRKESDPCARTSRV